MLETMKAAIFDMDGTLIDSMTRWREMNGAFVRQMGIIPTEKQEADMMSMSGTMVVDYFKNEFGLEPISMRSASKPARRWNPFTARACHISPARRLTSNAFAPAA